MLRLKNVIHAAEAKVYINYVLLEAGGSFMDH